TLAVGMGLFAVTYDTTLVQNASDRAAYQAGADFRLTLPSGIGSQESLRVRSEVTDLHDVAATTPVYRGQALAAAPDGTESPLDLLGVDSSSFEVVAADGWRADYAGVPLPTLLRRLASSVSDPLLGEPIIISDTMAQQLQRDVGDSVRLRVPPTAEAGANFLVVGIVRAFPTLYPTASPLGFAVADLDDIIAISRESNEKDISANEKGISAN